jgi:hypothetical protein
MRKWMLLCIAAGFLLGLAGVAGAHLGEMKFIFQFPDGFEPSQDGDLGDWDMVPDAYWVTADKMPNQFTAAVDLSDFNCRYAWGWNNTQNRLYFGGWIYDDMRHGSEHWSIEVDASHSGAEYDKSGENTLSTMSDEEFKRWRNARCQKYDFAYPQDPGGYIVRTKNAATWMIDLPWTAWGSAQLAGVPDDFETPDEVVQELMITPWEDLHWMGPDQSKIVDLEEGVIIGSEVNTGDKDADPGAYDDAYWRTFAGINAWAFADQFGDWLLAPVEEGLFPTAVESTTWGRIKSTFVK